jgi:hypothetical protein
MVVERMVKNTLPCYLTKYEWNVNNPYEKFCLNPKACTVDRIDYTRMDLCFSFGKGLRVLLYVKKSSIKSVDDNILSVVKKPNEKIFYFKSSSKSLKDNFELSKKSDISLSYIKSPNTNLKPHIHDLYKTISEIKSPEIVVSDKSKKISSSSVKSVHKSLKKEDNKNRIKELLEINKKLLLENKKNRSQIKELKLKIKLL